MADGLRLFVLYHRQKMLNDVKDNPCFVKINLSKIALGPLASNMLGEGRAFLTDLDVGDAEYVGFANARWDAKYVNLKTRLSKLPAYAADNVRPDVVLAPWATHCKWLNIGNNWYGFTLALHGTMKKLLDELKDVTGLDFDTDRPSLWANDFICHRLVFFDFLEHWRKCVQHFFGRYGHLLPFSTWGVDTSRYSAYFYERCGTIFWANRKDLTVHQIP